MAKTTKSNENSKNNKVEIVKKSKRGNPQTPEILKGFAVNPQNINRKGRPPKLETHIRKTGYSKSDIRVAFGELAFHTIGELKNLHNDPKVPAIIRIVSRMYFDSLKDGSFTKIKEIIEHVIGSAKQTITAKIETPKPPPLNFDKLTRPAMDDLLKTVVNGGGDVSRLKHNTLIQIARAVLSE